MSSKVIADMDWSAETSDSDLIESISGMLARKVYDGGSQYTTVNELTRFVLKDWEKISSDVVKKLIKSMQNRSIDVLQDKGGKAE